MINNLKKEDLLISERRMKRHLYNISLFRCVDKLYHYMNDSYVILKNIIEGKNAFPEQEWCYHTLDYLHNELNQAIYFWNTYKDYIISDISILTRTYEYVDTLKKSYLIFTAIYKKCIENEFYIHYLLEKTILLSKEVSEFIE
jgi:hypothetical protein